MTEIYEAFKSNDDIDVKLLTSIRRRVMVVAGYWISSQP
jgi:hypothetical protein